MLFQIVNIAHSIFRMNERQSMHHTEPLHVHNAPRTYSATSPLPKNSMVLSERREPPYFHLNDSKETMLEYEGSFVRRTKVGPNTHGLF